MNRREFVAAALALSAAQRIGPATAESGPVTRVIFPFAPGGSGDMLCRLLANYFPAMLDRSVIVENRTGGDGLIGIRAVKGASPDTSTVLVTTGPTMYLLPMVENQPSFDSAKDFVPVSQLARFEFVVVVSPTIGVTDFKQLVAWIKANPAKVTQGTVGYGNTQHLCGILMQKAIGVTWQLVPYRGGTPAMQDLLSGQFNIMCTASGSFLPLVRSKQIRAYAITTPKRAASAPEIPTVDEAGMPELHLAVWNALWAPKGTPRAVIDKLNAVAVEAMADPAFKRRMIQLALEMPPSDELTPEALATLQKSDIAKWWPVLKAAGIKHQ